MTTSPPPLNGQSSIPRYHQLAREPSTHLIYSDIMLSKHLFLLTKCQNEKLRSETQTGTRESAEYW